jgi:HEAT repeat protein
MKSLSLILGAAALLLITMCQIRAGEAEPELKDEVRSQCFAELVRALKAESPWVRVHAGEALAMLNDPDPALAAFRPQADSSSPPYRIGVWRVLAMAEGSPRRDEFVERIRRAFLDPDSPDQTHAVEAMAKLNVPFADDVERRRVRDLADGGNATAPFALWRLAQAGDTTAVARLVALLESNDETTRMRAGFILSRLQPLPESAGKALAAALSREPADSLAHPVLRAAGSLDAAREMAQDPHAPPYGRYLATMRLAEMGEARDRAILLPLLDNADPDVRVAAAFAILNIHARFAAATTQRQSAPAISMPARP